MSRMTIRDMTAVALFAALTAVGAWISFPLPLSPVPIALANLFAIMAGVLLGKWLGALSQIVYLLLGLAGVPVFAQFSSGAPVFAGPTGGYLIGYVLAAFLTGLLVEHLPRRLPLTLRLTPAFVAGGAIIYLPGVLWLAHVTGMSLSSALLQGCYYFLPGDALKIIVAVILCRSLLQVPQLWRSPAA